MFDYSKSLLLVGLLINATPSIMAAQDQLFLEKNGAVSVEAEAYHSQEKMEVRKWYFIDNGSASSLPGDRDPNHANTASGGGYLEVLPDTRTNHDEELIVGENFSNDPGKLAILKYLVKFESNDYQFPN